MFLRMYLARISISMFLILAIALRMIRISGECETLEFDIQLYGAFDSRTILSILIDFITSA